MRGPIIAFLVLCGFVLWIATYTPQDVRNLSAQPDKAVPSADTAATYEAMIRQFKFNCPAVKLIYPQGEDHYGTVVKVYCGPADAAGIYENAVFRVTMRDDNRFSVKPWK